MLKSTSYRTPHLEHRSKGLHIIYWGYGAENIAYGATIFCEGKHTGKQLFFKTYIYEARNFLQKLKAVQRVLDGCIYQGK